MPDKHERHFTSKTPFLHLTAFTGIGNPDFNFLFISDISDKYHNPDSNFIT